MAKLDTFKTAIGNGLRPNQFVVGFPEVPSVATLLQNEKMPYLCHATSLPGSSVGVAPVHHMGRMIPLAGERTFDPWTITVYADDAHAFRSAFERWSNLLNDYENTTGSVTPNAPSAYKGKATVTQLNKASPDGNNIDGKGIKSYEIMGIFPTNISEIQLSWAQNDVVEEFSVTFAVERVNPSGLSGSSSSSNPTPATGIRT